MSPRYHALLCILLLSPALSSQTKTAIPSKSEVKAIVRAEPITLANWPAWRARLLDWISDRTSAVEPAFEAGRKFMQEQSRGKVELPPSLSTDALAWYLLGNSFRMTLAKGPRDAGLAEAEAAYRRCLEIDPKFARAHRNLGFVYAAKDPGRADKRPGFQGLGESEWLRKAEAEYRAAERVDPTLPMSVAWGYLELTRNNNSKARSHFEVALREEPKDVQAANGLVQTILQSTQDPQSASREIQRIVERFPEDGMLACMNGFIQAAAGNKSAAHSEWARARELGTDPAAIFPANVVAQVENVPWWERILWMMVYFAVFYAVVMLLMAIFGLILASRTRGAQALSLLRPDDINYLSDGQIARHESETGLARLYGIALFIGLILFYAAIPFVLLGLVGVTGGALLLIFAANRIPVKLVIIIIVVGGGMIWAVLSSIFRRPPSGAFGLPKTAEECPRLHAAVADVARRVDTPAVDQIYLAPGSEIGVHQEGRGPFGILGVKRRVLTLGLSTMRYLTVGELQAILAHEYAHFSHKDTFYSRFIYQVHLSIGSALDGMGQAGGWINYVNPFYWFMFLYYKCYTLLSAGFSRSREFLADRMASHLYGSDTFTRALTKVCTDGTLFEMTMYSSVTDLLAKQQAFVNMYEAFKNYRDEGLPATEREDLYKKVLEEKGSLFASHPTYSERIAAIAELPKARTNDTRPALELFDNPDEIEKELTQFFTEYLAYIEHLRAQAMAEAAANG